MESPNRKQQLMRQYIEHSLQGVDLAEFRQLAQTDPDFRREAELERRISQAIRKGQRERALQTPQAVEVTSPDTGWVFPMKWVAAASVAVVLMAGFLVWKFNQPSPTDQLADKGQQFTIQQQEITPSQGLAGADSVQKTTIPILIYPGLPNQPKYSFRDDTLRLYGGRFSADSLILVVRKPATGSETYQLRANEVTYTLDRLATDPTALP